MPGGHGLAHVALDEARGALVVRVGERSDDAVGPVVVVGRGVRARLGKIGGRGADVGEERRQMGV